MYSNLFSPDSIAELTVAMQTQFPKAIWETFYVTLLSTALAVVIGLPLGVLLVAGEKGGVLPLPKALMSILNVIINLLRSIPFLILMIMVFPLSRLIIGTTVGTTATIVPLVVAAFPFVARLVESSLREVDPNSMLVRRSFGYRIKLSPIQVITLYNAIANDGKMISPILVRELRRDGDVVKHFKTQTLVDKVCSERTLREVRKLLESVGTEGTGAGFFRDTTLYTVAAKTGTAQYADDKIGYRDGYYIGSMVAYFPAHNPRYTVLTTIHTKRQAGKSYYGGPLSGPVVKKVVTYLYNREHDWDLSPENSGEKHYPRRIKGGDIAQIRRIADKFSPRTSFEDRKGWGTVRIDSLSNVTISTLAQDDQTMPNVVGMGLKDALFLLESRGLRVSFSGRGSVQYQSIAPGTRISRGGAVTITLK